MKKNIISISLAITLLATPGTSSAFFYIPPIVTDYMKYAKEQLKTMQTQGAFTEKMEQMYEYFEQLGLLGSQEIDNENAAWTSKIARGGKQAQTIQNLEMASVSVPAFMPCGSLTNNVLLKNIYIEQNNFLKDQGDKLDSIGIVSDPKDKTKKTLTGELIKALDKTIDKNASNFTNDSSGSGLPDKNEALYSPNERPHMTNASLLMSSSSELDTLDKDQQEAMEAFVLLVAPPYQTSSYELEIAENNKELRLEQIANEVRHNLVNQIFNKILAKKISIGNEYPSEIAIMSNNVREIYLNPDNPKLTVAYKIQTSDLANPGTVQRNYAILLANRVHNSILQYEEALNVEAIIASRLLEKINN